MSRKTPHHPGKVLYELVLKESGLNQHETAHALRISRQSLSRVIHGHTDITPTMALRVAHVFGGNAEVWLRMQTSYNLAQAQKKFSTTGLVPHKALSSHVLLAT